MKLNDYWEERLSEIAYNFLEHFDGVKLKMGDKKCSDYLVDVWFRSLVEEVIISCVGQIEVGMFGESENSGIFGPIEIK